MNGNFYANPTFPNNQSEDYYSENSTSFNTTNDKQMGRLEQSYIENILRMNMGKSAKFFVSYPESSAWQNKEYIGTIEGAGKDHLIVKDTSSGSWYLIRMIYLDYVEFMEPINYSAFFYNQDQ